MSGSKYYFLFFSCLMVVGCIPRPAKFDPGMPADQLPKGFFSKLPPLLQLDHKRSDYSQEPITDNNMIVAGFAEKYIEKDNLLALSGLSDQSSYSPVSYDSVVGFSQQLFLYHIQTQPDKNDAIVFMAARYNNDGQCIGTGPYYLGTVNFTEKHIDFMYTLSLSVKNGDTSLVSEKPIGKLQKMTLAQRYPSRIVFVYDALSSAEGKTGWDQIMTGGIAVTKIINYNYNKVGGTQPVVFDIPHIMRDLKAIQFTTPKSFDE